MYFIDAVADQSSGQELYAVSICFVYLPSRAAPLRRARSNSACWPRALFVAWPCPAFSAAAWRARPYEKLSTQGCRDPIAFIALRLAVAASSLCPPDRKKIPG